jgi:hypothetical protein
MRLVLCLLFLSLGCAAKTDTPLPPPVFQLDPVKTAQAIEQLRQHVVAIEKKLKISYPKEEPKK